MMSVSTPRAAAAFAAFTWIDTNRSPPAPLAMSARACRSSASVAPSALSVLRV